MIYQGVRFKVTQMPLLHCGELGAPPHGYLSSHQIEDGDTSAEELIGSMTQAEDV